MYPRLANTSEDLKYYYVKLMCIHGGVHKKRKICQEQRNTSGYVTYNLYYIILVPIPLHIGCICWCNIQIE